MGRPPIGTQAMTSTERSRRRRDQHRNAKPDATVSATKQSVAALLRVAIAAEASRFEAESAVDPYVEYDLQVYAEGVRLALALPDNELEYEFYYFVDGLIDRARPKAKRPRRARAASAALS
jgi:hypothetical protein